ncbi:LamG domain-containing protein [Nonomuraea aurantiaca]|uniref:LamG domain-containing protein n=1 Tax=Nonomuraea aurantiaca TaxID=2878562 RepID=UPI001CD9690F|nr:LamG domain-containing protein [Nonomuraea aurantiaca]MCA2229583.1 LamG domain-containing protein [Nonomuraea aurantiaca]
MPHLRREDSLDSETLQKGFTLETWVKPAYTPHPSFLFYMHPNWREQEYDTTGPIQIRQDGNTIMVLINNRTLTSGPIPEDTWTHLAIISDGNTARLFANGAEVSSLGGTGDIFPWTATGRFRLGAVSNSEYDGYLDEFRFYTTPLNAEQIQHDMRAPIVSRP